MNDQEPKQRRKLPPCFRCQIHFWGKHHTVLVSAEDGLPRKFHKACAEAEKKDNPSGWEE